MTTCEMSIELGAYVLHALEEDEDAQVRHHVADCDLCQDEVRDLSFTASLLALLNPEDVAQLEVETRGIAPSDGAGRRRPRRRTVLAVAAALVATLWVPGTQVLHHSAGAPAATVIRASDPTTNVTAAVTLARQDSGTRVHLDLSGAYPQGWCSLVARARDGRSDTAATWRADASGAAEVAGTTAIPTSALRELDVVTDTGTVLVRIPVHRHNG
jgi:hypothetical protein